jgi:hypothetical protein
MAYRGYPATEPRVERRAKISDLAEIQVQAHCTKYMYLAEIFAPNALGSAADWLFPPRASCSAQARAP